MDAGHLPMPGGGVLAGRRQRGFAVRTHGRGIGSESRKGPDICQSQPAKMRKLQWLAPLREHASQVAQGVAAWVAVSLRIGHLADAHAIDDDPYDAFKAHCFRGSTV